MNKVIKWLGIVLGGLVGLAVIVVLVLLVMGNGRYGKTYDVPKAVLAVATDSANKDRGKHIAEATAACTGCHGSNLSGGQMFMNDAVGTVFATNLTSGKGGIGKQYSDEDWVRAIRHGLHKNGTAIMIMPSNGYYTMTNKDLGDLIAYLKSIPPVDKEVTPTSLGFMGSIILATGGFPPFPADLISHTAVRPDATRETISAEYGLYLTKIGGCKDCHGANLAGAQPMAPGAKYAPGITPAALSKWTETDFLRTMRSGVKPDGKQMDESMPSNEYGKMTNNELKAMWMYLLSLRQ
ncbi:MAG: c-type cytochrome [Dehalococcoidia bacterium]|nr:c-type cytochrome [Dehalococcoidia bacterium]